MFAQIMDGNGWQFSFYPDEGLRNFAAMAYELSACDIAYQIGGRVTVGKFLRLAKILQKKKIVMHWTGTDTLDERGVVAAGLTDPWVASKMLHWAEAQWMVEEVNSLGLQCELVPLPSSQVAYQPDPAPLPDEFSVLVYVPSVERSQLYGLDKILAVAESLPSIPFTLVGLKERRISGAPRNLKIHGRIANLEKFYERATVIWRPTRHDGKSFMVQEALSRGRHVLWSYAFPGCIHTRSAEDAIVELSRLYSLHNSGSLRINEEGMEVIRKQYLPGELKRQILDKLERFLQV
jgi:hypothetical protein